MATVDPTQRNATQSNLERIANHLERAQLAEYVQLLNSPRKLIMTNLLAGAARGVGIAIGVTVFSATIVYVLRQIGALDLPIIGHYIADLVESVQAHMQGGGGFYY
ncbi:DUF5665 domain-containing protein [Paenibacillus sp.]|uniref:DUF5665 domain-containing protein n=1 Tax=Paenibacillus sp. TaxID=58172 RepID=UPI002D5200A0|nr:DUF5665 domain-containing protein [Paenibacillus sp.]HZG55167.1 DUF5665 domain-containing protein [Paenibacillus sp.]